jgi:hypothetical protein
MVGLKQSTKNQHLSTREAPILKLQSARWIKTQQSHDTTFSRAATGLADCDLGYLRLDVLWSLVLGCWCLRSFVSKETSAEPGELLWGMAVVAHIFFTRHALQLFSRHFSNHYGKRTN